MALPRHESEFEALSEQGKTVIYADTQNAETPPGGEGWILRGENRIRDEKGNVSVVSASWGKIVTFEEAEEVNSQQ